MALINSTICSAKFKRTVIKKHQPLLNTPFRPPPVTTEEPKNPETASIAPSTSSSEQSLKTEKIPRNIKSAFTSKTIATKWHNRASTAKPKKQSPVVTAGKDREQGL